jgi:hypothetical protein
MDTSRNLLRRNDFCVQREILTQTGYNSFPIVSKIGWWTQKSIKEKELRLVSTCPSRAKQK